MPRKPRNLRKVKVGANGSLYGLNPYVHYDPNNIPTRVTLDAEFGIEDLVWIINKIKSNKQMNSDQK
jgi:hypothetical protein